MKEIEESSVGNVIFSLLLFLFMSKENMFFYYLFFHTGVEERRVITHKWFCLHGTLKTHVLLFSDSRLRPYFLHWLMLFNLFVFLQVVVQSVTYSVVLCLCHINPAASRFYTTSRGTLSSVTHVLLFVVFRRRLCDSHKHPNNVGKYSSRPRRMFYDLGVQTCDRTTETQPELSVSSSHLHLLHSRVFVSWIISHDYNEQENEDRRGRTVSFHPWQTSRCVK